MLHTLACTARLQLSPSHLRLEHLSEEFLHPSLETLITVGNEDERSSQRTAVLRGSLEANVFTLVFDEEGVWQLTVAL